MCKKYDECQRIDGWFTCSEVFGEIGAHEKLLRLHVQGDDLGDGVAGP